MQNHVVECENIVISVVEENDVVYLDFKSDAAIHLKEPIWY